MLSASINKLKKRVSKTINAGKARVSNAISSVKTRASSVVSGAKTATASAAQRARSYVINKAGDVAKFAADRTKRKLKPFVSAAATVAATIDKGMDRVSNIISRPYDVTDETSVTRIPWEGSTKGGVIYDDTAYDPSNPTYLGEDGGLGDMGNISGDIGVNDLYYDTQGVGFDYASASGDEYPEIGVLDEPPSMSTGLGKLLAIPALAIGAAYYLSK